MNKETLARMNHMKLYGMHLAFKSVVEQNGAPGLTADQLVGHLVDAEYDDRYNRKIARLLKNARLRYKAAIEDIAFDPQRNMDRETIIRLAEGIYLDKAENVFITGSTGVGKSYLACALGHQALLCRSGYAKAMRAAWSVESCTSTHHGSSLNSNLPGLTDPMLRSWGNSNDRISSSWTTSAYSLWTAQIVISCWRL